MIIELPLPAPELSPNARVFWAVRDAATRAAKDMVIAAVREQIPCGEPWQRATLKFTFIKPRRGRRDKDNLIASAKAYQDGLVEAGLIVDDNADVLDTPQPDIFYEKGVGKTIMEVTENVHHQTRQTRPAGDRVDAPKRWSYPKGVTVPPPG
jgi:Holliday junction resolvase RusA-like endonuclease